MHATAATAPNWHPEEIAVWTPPERLLISEWAEKYRVLTEPSEEKGPLRLKRTPYLVPVLDCFLDPAVETVVLCKSAQIAGTEAMISVIGYFAHQEPCAIMLVMADEDTADYMSRERVQKMFRTSRELSSLITEERFNKQEIALTNGSYIAMGWASSVSKLASRPMRVVIFDECDKPGYLISTNEGSAISLGVQRTETYFNRKIGILSTPTGEEGNVWKRLLSCDAIFDWHVPCPQCGQYQPLRWDRKHVGGFDDGLYRADDGTFHELGGVVWEGGREATPEQIEQAGYQCGECGSLWTTLEKNRAVELGKMLPRGELLHSPKKVGFHINRLYSLLGKSGDIPKLVSEWIAALDDPKELQGFVNSALAEPWKQVIVTNSESQILKARCALPPQVVPAEAVALTCFVDVQKYGRWFAVRAWARDFTSWLIHYGALSDWEEVEDLLFGTAYPVADSQETMRIWRAAVDTGGGDREDGLSMTEDTYNWLRRNGIGRGCRVWGTKGSSTPLAGKVHLGKPLDKTPSGKPIPGGLQIVQLNTDQLKDAFHYRLRMATEQMPQGAYLHSETDQVYFKQILAEEKRMERGGIEKWVQLRKANHLLDCEIGNLALADPEWPGGGVNLLALYLNQQNQEAVPRGKHRREQGRASRW